MSRSLPMFPLNSVVFPGMRVPLNVFERRYRKLVRHLLASSDPKDRLLGTVAIRAGYEVGEHGAQTVHTTGVLLQMTECIPHADGGFEIEVLARQRLHLVEMQHGDGFPRGEVELLEDEDDDLAEAQSAADKALADFGTYRDRLSGIRGDSVRGAAFGSDPTFLSYALSATALLPVQQRQALLEAESATSRLHLLRGFLHEEMRAMRALPSLPAMEIARSGWSPN